MEIVIFLRNEIGGKRRFLKKIWLHLFISIDIILRFCKTGVVTPIKIRLSFRALPRRFHTLLSSPENGNSDHLEIIRGMDSPAVQTASQVQ